MTRVSINETKKSKFLSSASNIADQVILKRTSECEVKKYAIAFWEKNKPHIIRMIETKSKLGEKSFVETYDHYRDFGGVGHKRILNYEVNNPKSELAGLSYSSVVGKSVNVKFLW